MEQSNLKKYVNNKDIKSIPEFMVFVLHEPALASQYITSLSKLWELQVKFFDTVDEVLNRVYSAMFEEDYLYVVYDDGKTQKKELYYETLNNLHKHIIICIPDADIKSACYKKYKNSYVFFEKIDFNSLVQYANARLSKMNLMGYDISHIKSLVNACDGCLGCLNNELDKISTLSGEAGVMYLTHCQYPNIHKPTILELANMFLGLNNISVDSFQMVDKNDVVSLLLYMYNIVRKRFLSSGSFIDKTQLLSVIHTYNDVISGKLKPESALKAYFLRIHDNLDALV